KFRRIDLEHQPVVLVDADNVSDTSRGTTISQNGARVSTIEHLMAALVGLQIDNVLIDIDGPEVPIMDGSSAPFVKAIEETGYINEGPDHDYYKIPNNIHHTKPIRKVEMLGIPVD